MVPQGYKQTEVGIIPEDWEVNSIGYVFSTYPTATYTREQLGDSGDVKYIHYGDIHTKYHTHLNLSWASIPTITDKQALRYMHLRNGDLILADASEDYAGVGNCVEIIGQNNINAISGLHTILLRDTESVFADGFRGYITQIAAVKSQLEKQAVGTKVYSISYSTIKDCLLPIPLIDEQRRIAEVLSDTDELIAALDKKIAKKKLIKQAAMQQLLTGKRRLQGFSGEWHIITLGEHSTMSSGGTPLSSNPEYYDGHIPFLSISDITTAGKYINNTEKKITNAGLNNSSAKVFAEGTIMYAMYASLGKCAIANIPLSCSQAILGIIPNSDVINPEYLYYYLCSIEDSVKELGQTGTQTNLSKQLVEKFSLALPKNTIEQQAIATILSDMDAEISDLERKRDKYKHLKNGMMQKLLTGQIRIR